MAPEVALSGIESDKVSDHSAIFWLPVGETVGKLEAVTIGKNLHIDSGYHTAPPPPVARHRLWLGEIDLPRHAEDVVLTAILNTSLVVQDRPTNYHHCFTCELSRLTTEVLLQPAIWSFMMSLRDNVFDFVR